MKRLVVIAVTFTTLGAIAGALASGSQKTSAEPPPFVINVESVLGAQLNQELEPVKTVPLGETGTQSARVVMVSTSLPSQTRADHDEIALVLKGKGDLTLGGRTREVRRGDLIFIPKGTSHQFVSTGGPYAGLLFVASPRLRGDDAVPVESRGR